MSSFSQHDLAMMEARLARGRKPTEPARGDAVADGREKTLLHHETLGFLRAEGVAFIHSPNIGPSTQTPGSPDFIVFAPGGRVLPIEFKTRSGKLSQEQAIWHHLARRAGHEVHVLRSMAEFYELYG